MKELFFQVINTSIYTSIFLILIILFNNKFCLNVNKRLNADKQNGYHTIKC